MAHALAFALRYEGRKRARNPDEIMAEIVAKRLVDYQESHRFVVMRKPPTPAERRSRVGSRGDAASATARRGGIGGTVPASKCETEYGTVESPVS